MNNRRILIRRIGSENFLNIFLITAVLAILTIRLFLKLTGYPQVGGESLHIAHMLWGGLLMLVALMMAFLFIGKSNLTGVAVLGGAGFGAFIDEIGKFVTRDNDYFFQPSVALMYVSFILIFLGTRAVLQRTHFSQTEYLINAAEQLEEVALHDLDEDEKKQMKTMLESCDAGHILVAPLGELLERIQAVRKRPAGKWNRLKRLLRQGYRRIASLPGFSEAVILFFVIQLSVHVVTAFTLVFLHGLGWEQMLEMRLLGRIAQKIEHLSFIDMIHLASSGLSGFFIIVGIVRMPTSRLRAYRSFERSVLLSIFITQIFIFYKEQFAGLIGFILNIMIWLALRYLIERETLQPAIHRKRAAKSQP